MIDDPVVLILREAAIRGRQLRLAREQVTKRAMQLDEDVSEAQPIDHAASLVSASLSDKETYQ